MTGELPSPRTLLITRRQALVAGGLSLAATAAHSPSSLARAQEASPVPASDEAFPPDVQLQLAAIVDTAMAQTNTPGALVGVWYPGRGTWTAAAGISDLGTAAPVMLEDHVRIASITKTFTATVVLQLVEEGRLSLDDRLETFITGIPNGEEITLRQVLNMTAGIYNYVFDPLIADDYTADPLLPFDPAQVPAMIQAHGEADFAPGAEVRYSDSNYVLLGLIVEQVTGRSVAAEITERIIIPLGLSGTSYPDTPELPAPFLRGYAAAQPGDPLRDVTRSNPAVAAAAGAMISTVGDLRIWAEALATGSLLSPELQAERLDFQWYPPIQTPTGEQLFGYGLGVFSFNGFIGHNGGILGYSSWMVYEPETGSTIVVVTNRAATEGGTADGIFTGIARLLFPDHFPTATPVATPAP